MMMNTRAEAFAPATVANLGVGFDILGLAISEPGDMVRVEWSDIPGAQVAHIEGDGGLLPREPEKNTACVAATSVLQLLGVKKGVSITLLKGLPLASGLGSSSASAVAAALAVNALCGSPLSVMELLPAALDGEAAVSGRHADNVAPCLFGGITLVTGIEADDIHRLPIPQALYLALVTPDVPVPTALARSVLPASISLRDMVAQTAGVGRVVDALYRGDVAALACAMESDRVVEPARAHLMPRLAEMRTVARANGALGLVISGAGPTLCAICDAPEQAEQAASAMQVAYERAGIAAVGRHTRVSDSGAKVLQIVA